MTKLTNPRGYLSWSAISLWLRSPDRYKQKYFYGDDTDPGNILMDYGKKTADALESGGKTGDELLDMLVAVLPKYDKREHEMRATLKTPYGEVDLLGKLDTFNPDTLDFREYKTGRTPWTKKRAQGHKQLHHYQTLIWLTHGKLAQNIHLDWAQTDYTDSGTVQLTGSVKTFDVLVGMTEVLEYITLVSTVAKEIDEAYKRAFAEIL